MPGVPIVKLHDVLLVTIQDELLDYSVDELQQQITEQVVEQQARGVLIDISVLDVVDSFLARTLHDIAAATSLLAAKTVVVGMRPAVAITLVELGLVLAGLQTALSVEEALDILHEGGRPRRTARR
ncbi:STAS domain-containing protein [Amycolatopsis acidiphila]|uniref:STAS domain-containing protein n=1 Tax=Amycolatopsis acidiphila TaxID=715473 RepID=A0A557ZZ14_9PSEU|nr:STAS domain-containing protein [Amycolatopsis acidiphila]TVT17253.1 STAS domain-containing protein [Amycolatopsis acidiphila]UIJ62943.1 STAS domain-containing protein [Amycolatopsis acidiphila]GHG65201.1 anti-anti-sigma factor [Amycolatopsis acidiphila]